jgi:hypothetical protein
MIINPAVFRQEIGKGIFLATTLFGSYPNAQLTRT